MSQGFYDPIGSTSRTKVRLPVFAKLVRFQDALDKVNLMTLGLGIAISLPDKLTIGIAMVVYWRFCLYCIGALTHNRHI